MKASKNIGHLRAHLFNQLDMLCDLSKPVDIERSRMVCETSKQIIDSAKVEIEFAHIMKGAVTLPFIEDQDDSDERPHPSTPPAVSCEPKPAPAALTADERMQAALNSGPPPGHPWRGLGSRVHRLER